MVKASSIALAAAVSILLGWGPAAADKFSAVSSFGKKAIAAIGESEAAKRVLHDVSKSPSYFKRLYPSMEPFAGKAAEPAPNFQSFNATQRGTAILNDDRLSKAYLEQRGVDTKKFEIVDGALHLNPPMKFKLFWLIPFTVSKIPLWETPSLFSLSSVACLLSSECSHAVAVLKSKVIPRTAGSGSRPVAGT
jgi:hypothetical protein